MKHEVSLFKVCKSSKERMKDLYGKKEAYAKLKMETLQAMTWI